MTTEVNLSHLDDAFANAVPPPDAGSLVDGKYQFRIEEMSIAQSTQSNTLLLKWKLKVVGPHSIGTIAWRNNVLEEKNMPYIKKDLAKVGLHPQPFSTIATEKDKVVGLHIQGTVKNKDGFMNIYIDKAIQFIEGAIVEAADDE